MLLDANLHGTVTILKHIPADYDASFGDGSFFDKKSKHYKDTVKNNKANYKFLEPYIKSHTPLEINGLDFPRRDKGCLDNLKLFTVGVFDDNSNEYYTFNATTEQDDIVCKNREYYICDFQWV